MQLITKIRKTCNKLDPNGKLYDIVVNRGLDIANPLAIREFIVEFEKLMGKHSDAVFGDQDDCPLRHSFAPGIYCREIAIPAGSLIVGKIHKHKHPNFLLKGKVSVLTELGGVEVLEGPLSMISEPGTKRLLYAHTDLVWTTIHLNPLDIQNLEEIEEEIIAKDYNEYEKFKAEQEVLEWHGSQQQSLELR